MSTPSSPSIPFLLLTTAYLNAKSLPTLLSPRLTITLLAPTSRPPTEVETYLCRSLALTLLILTALAIAEVIKLSSDANSPAATASSSPTSTETENPTTIALDSSNNDNSKVLPASTSTPSPAASPLVLFLTAFHALSFLHAYITYTSARGPGSATLAPSSPNTSLLVFDATCSGFLSVYGLWVIVFGAGQHISRRTGRDKRTSRWPFGKGDRERKRR